MYKCLEKLTYNYFKNKIEKLYQCDENEKNKWLFKRLKRLLVLSYNKSNYYYELFNSINFNPNNFVNISQFKYLPTLSKEIAKKNIDKILINNFPRYLIQKKTTGGSTGQPFSFYTIKKFSGIIEQAFIHSIWKDFGYENKMKVATLRGNIIGDEYSNNISFYDKDKNVMLLSSYLMSKKNIREYLEIIRSFDPQFIHAYPSSLNTLINLAEEYFPIKLASLKGIICASENLYDWQRVKFEKAFGVNCWAHYGCAEGVVLGKYLRELNSYKINPFYSYVELIDKNGNVIEDEDIEGEIVGTNLWNFAFPLIRYRTGDIGKYKKIVVDGKEQLVLANLLGREQESLYAKDGSEIQLTGNYLIDKDIDGIEQIQLEQNEFGKVLVKIIKNEKFTEKDKVKIIDAFKAKYRDAIKPEIIFTNEILFASNGKHKYLIQNIKK